MKKYAFLTARSGEIVPVINGLPLHSAVDPAREAEKLISSIPPDTGFLVFLGLGGGFAPHAALQKTSGEVIVIDYDKNNLNKLTEAIDFSALLNNNRFTLLIDPSNDEIKKYILSRYKPALHGGIKVLPLRTRIEHDKNIFEEAAAAVKDAILAVSQDYSVQAHFGKRWFCNIIRNITNIRKNDFNRCLPADLKETAIAAAGPSLDSKINDLKNLKDRGVFIISSDTAISSLLNNGIKPDVIVSIDCQHISYYHFLGYNIKDIPLVLDIASPSFLSDLSLSSLYFASGHPLAHYISQNRFPLPQLDTSGGNVTHACLSLAEILGAENITLFGADFAYIKSQTYARGTYVYPYFERRQNRLCPLEKQLSAFLYRNPFLEQEPGCEYRETSQLRFYRERLEEKAGVSIAPGSGVPVLISQNTQRTRSKQRVSLINSAFSAKEFLYDYRKKIENLSGTNDQKIINTLLPYAAFIKHRNPNLKLNELMEITKRLCIEEIDKVI